MFKKRVYTTAVFRQHIDELTRDPAAIRAAMRSGRVSRAFGERIMLAVTQVNGCRYCHWGHVYAARQAGVSDADIAAIVAGEFGELPADEVEALVFAQHWAETEGQPHPDALRALEATYGPQTAADIFLHIRMITVGNLLGNTFDALLYRIRGQGPAYSRLREELAVLALTPVYPVWALLTRGFRTKSTALMAN